MAHSGTSSASLFHAAVELVGAGVFDRDFLRLVVQLAVGRRLEHELGSTVPCRSDGSLSNPAANDAMHCISRRKIRVGRAADA